MSNLIIGFILIVIGVFALAVGAFPITIFLGITGLLMMIKGLLGITGTVLGGGYKLASQAITTKTCPYCQTRIPTGASICPQCRSNLVADNQPKMESQNDIEIPSSPDSDKWSF